VTINGQSGGDVVGVGGLMVADMKFVYRTDPDQMPVRRLIVQWGDNLAGYSPGMETTNSFADRRGLKENGNSACDASSFSTSPNACVDRPFAMSHTYTCPGPGFPACGPDGRPQGAALASGCWDANFARPGGGTGACVYIPRVHVKDNWGFCTGRCPNATSYITRADGEKCFDGTGLAGPGSLLNTNECGAAALSPPDGAWTYFQGRVIVGPP